MKKICLLALALSVAVFSGTAAKKAAAKAQDETKKEAAAPGSEQVDAIRLAGDLVKYGYAKQSALPLLDALQIIAENPLAGTVDGKLVEGSQEGAAAADKKGKVTLDVAQIAKDAKSYADGDEKMVAMIDEAEKAAQGSHRGAVGGARSGSYRLPANSNHVFNLSFRAGQTAEVAIIGDGDTDLDLYVYDQNGNLIGSDADYTDNCYVSWTPRWTGNFKIKVINRGRVYNDYVLLTN